MASSKSLTASQNEHLRGVVRRLVAETFDGNASRAARALGVTQSLVSEFLSGARGAGPKLVQGVADYTGSTIDALYGRPGALPAVGLAPRLQWLADAHARAHAAVVRAGLDADEADVWRLTAMVCRAEPANSQRLEEIVGDLSRK